MSIHPQGITEADRDAAALHLWDEGLVRPEAIGRAVIEELVKLGWSPALPETPRPQDISTEDREALAENARELVDRIAGWKHLRKFSGMSAEWMDVLRDAIICRVLDTRRPSPPTEQQWEEKTHR